LRLLVVRPASIARAGRRHRRCWRSRATLGMAGRHQAIRTQSLSRKSSTTALPPHGSFFGWRRERVRLLVVRPASTARAGRCHAVAAVPEHSHGMNGSP